jgi:segregation and condensation protein A
VVVARFLALLELFRDAAVTFEQDGPLALLTVRALARDEQAGVAVAQAHSEFDEKGQG